MRPFVTRSVVRLRVSVCRSRAVNPAETDEPIEMPFGVWTRAAPMNHVFDVPPPDRLHTWFNGPSRIGPLEGALLWRRSIPKLARGRYFQHYSQGGSSDAVSIIYLFFKSRENSIRLR